MTTARTSTNDATFAADGLYQAEAGPLAANGPEH
jgi:hypothetical protein